MSAGKYFFKSGKWKVESGNMVKLYWLYITPALILYLIQSEKAECTPASAISKVESGKWKVEIWNCVGIYCQYIDNMIKPFYLVSTPLDTRN